MGSGSSSPWSGELAEALERLRVNETVQQLRREMEELLERLAEAERAPASGAGEPGREATSGVGGEEPGREATSGVGGEEPGHEATSGLGSEIENVGRKVDRASSLLTDLTELLEVQAERIQHLEERLEEAESKARVNSGTHPAPAEGGLEGARRRLQDLEEKLAAVLAEPEPAQPAAVATRPEPVCSAPVEPAYPGRLEAIEEALRSIESRLQCFAAETRDCLNQLDSRLGALASAAGETGSREQDKDRRIQELEERLMILVEATGMAGESRPAPPSAAAQPRPVMAVPEPEVARPETVPLPSSAAQEATVSETLQGLERIVERELSVCDDGIRRAGGDATTSGKDHPTVMVVDDAVDARALLSMYLSRTGFQVVTASSAEDCLAKLRHHDVDAIVLDASLPGADGGHVCRVLRSEAAYASKRATPVIVYTAYPDAYTRRLVEKWHADDYVIKGGDMLPLMASLIRHTRSAAEAS